MVLLRTEPARPAALSRMQPRRLDVWPPLPPSVWTRPRLEELPFPLGDARCRLFARGRHALWHGLHAYSLAAGDAILAPAYHHGSEIEVFSRMGIECRFYALNELLEPGEEQLDSLLTPEVRALQIIHYLGYPQDVSRWRRWCDERGLLLIEDAAMAWMAGTPDGPVGSHGDVAIFCLYKTFGLPDGAALVAGRSPEEMPAAGPPQVRSVAGLHLAWVAHRFALPPLRNPDRRPGEPDSYEAERDFELEGLEQPIGSATRKLLPRLADPAAAARRRANARVLLEGLGDLVPPPFDRIPPGAVPFAFPVRSNDKHRMLDRLARNGVAAVDFWSVPHPTLPVEEFPDCAERRATTIGLPVHQELRPHDLEAIVAAALGARRRRRAEPRLEVLPNLEAARATWQKLAPCTRNIFATWEWASTWWRYFGHDAELQLIACELPGRADRAAILPLYADSSGPTRTLRFLGHGPADQLGPICAPEDTAFAARALRRSLRDRFADWDVFLGEYLPAEDGWDALLGAGVLTSEASPVLDIETKDWDAFLAERSSSLRKQIRYQERRLEREHDLRYRLVSDPDRLDEDFEQLCRLHELRWKGGESHAFAGPRRSFLRDFARCAMDRGWLRLWFLELDGEPAAGWLGFRFEDVESYYQGGRDPRWDRLSVGAVLVAHTVRCAVEDGMSQYRFLRGGEAYKDRLATSDPAVVTLALAGSLKGRAVLALLAMRRMAGRARRALVQADS